VLIGKVREAYKSADELERMLARVRRAFVADAVVPGEDRLHLVDHDDAVRAHCPRFRSARQMGHRREAPP
jgi:hypothetical protein